MDVGRVGETEKKYDQNTLYSLPCNTPQSNSKPRESQKGPLLGMSWSTRERNNRVKMMDGENRKNNGFELGMREGDK